MMSYKQIISNAIILMFICIGNASAQVCYNPYYGYFNCQVSSYYYPDDSAFVEGEFVGAVIGGFYYNNGDGYGHQHWNNGGGGHGNWGGHGGGRGGHRR